MSSHGDGRIVQRSLRRRFWFIFQHYEEQYWWVVAGVAALAFLLGLIGYRRTGCDWGEAIYSSFQLFFLQNKYVSSDPDILRVALFLAPVTAFAATIRLLLNYLGRRLHERRSTRWKDHVIVCGLGRLGTEIVDALLGDCGRERALAGSLENKLFAPREEDCRIVVIEEDPDNPFIEYYRDRNVVVVVGDAKDTSLLERQGLRRASHLVLCTGSDERNMEIAMRARSHCNKEMAGDPGREITCFLPYRDPNLCSFLRRQEYLHQKDDGFHLEFLDLYQAVARSLLEEVSVHQDRGHRIVLVGEGNLLESFLVELANWELKAGASAPSGLSRPPQRQIVVVGPNADEAVLRYGRIFPGLEDVCKLEGASHDLVGDGLADAVGLDPSRAEPPERVIICCEDEEQGLRCALDLFPRARDLGTPVYLWMTGDPGLEDIIRGESQSGSEYLNIHPFRLNCDRLMKTREMFMRLGQLARKRGLSEGRGYLSGVDLRKNGFEIEAWYGQPGTSRIRDNDLDDMAGQDATIRTFYCEVEDVLGEFNYRLVRREYVVGLVCGDGIPRSEVAKIIERAGGPDRTGKERASGGASSEATGRISGNLESAVNSVATILRDHLRDGWMRADTLTTREVERDGPGSQGKWDSQIDLLLVVGDPDKIKLSEENAGPVVWIDPADPFRVRWENMVLERTVLENLARAIHETYVEYGRRRQDSGVARLTRTWKELTEQYRESNRAQARHFCHSLAEYSLQVVPLRAPGTPITELPDGVIKELSKSEHRRWLEEKQRGFWCFGPMRKEESLLNPSIVEWEDLPEPSRAYTEYANRVLPSVLSRVGLKIVTRSIVELIVGDDVLNRGQVRNFLECMDENGYWVVNMQAPGDGVDEVSIEGCQGDQEIKGETEDDSITPEAVEAIASEIIKTKHLKIIPIPVREILARRLIDEPVAWSNVADEKRRTLRNFADRLLELLKESGWDLRRGMDGRDPVPPEHRRRIGHLLSRFIEKTPCLAHLDRKASTLEHILEMVSNQLKVVRIMAKTVIERLAQAIHELYLLDARSRGIPMGSKPALVPWSDLPEEYRESNRNQAKQYQEYMKHIGLQIVTREEPGAPIRELDASDVEDLAEKEHERWMKEKERAGWRYGPVRDDEHKFHPDMVPWSQLPDDVREVDRMFIRAIPQTLERAGLKLVKAA